VDAPSDPPCQRCKREKKTCYFTETRRKRKAGEADGLDAQDEYHDRVSHESEDRELSTGQGGGYAGSPTLDATRRRGMHSTPEQARQPEIRVKGEGEEVRNSAAAALFQTPIHQPGDALQLLVDAASRTQSMANDERRKSGSSLHGHKGSLSGMLATTTGPAIDPAILKLSTQTRGQGEDATAQSSHINNQRQQPLDPDLVASSQTWSRSRFVRAGWFTAREGAAFMEYFTANLSQLTPTPVADFSDYNTQIRVLTEEPMLAVTILCITSRYMSMTGAGASTRGMYIHTMLWEYLQGMITRMFWGQEQSGGGFCGAGTAAQEGRGLRSLATVESLLLLSDWHPRAMHFPPSTADEDLVLPIAIDCDAPTFAYGARSQNSGWKEPAVRSDRMSWSLVNTAYNLAVELGVFDSITEKDHYIPGYANRCTYDPARADRVGRLLHIYMSQTCGRLGYPNMLPDQGRKMDLEYFRMNVDPNSATDLTPAFAQEQIQRAWAELTAIMRRINADLFRTRELTMQSINSGDYMAIVKGFWDNLRQWLVRFESITVPPLAKTILMMEYEYTRLFVNSVSLQATLEQYAQATNGDPAAANSTSSALFSEELVAIAKDNAPYIAEVTDAARNLLRHVVHGLVPTGGLKHSPVRTNFRILSGAMFILKTFALGAKEADVNTSIHLLNDTVAGLRSSVIDDIHLGLRVADLMAGLVASISTKFVRVPVPQRHSVNKRHRASLSSRPSGLSNISSSHVRRPADVAVSGASIPSNSAGYGGNGNGIVLTPTPNQGAGNADLPFAPPVVNPNDPSIMIMPPPDYVYSFDTGANMYGQPNGYPANTFVPNSTGSTSNPNQGQGRGSRSPGLSSQQQTQGMLANHAYSGQQQQQQPYSPASPNSAGTAGGGSGGGGAGQGSYDWYALDVNPLLHSTQQGQAGQSANGSASGGAGAGGQGVQGQFGGQGGSVVGWGNMFGPEIGTELEMLGQLADGLGFDEGTGGGIGWWGGGADGGGFG